MWSQENTTLRESLKQELCLKGNNEITIWVRGNWKCRTSDLMLLKKYKREPNAWNTCSPVPRVRGYTISRWHRSSLQADPPTALDERYTEDGPKGGGSGRSSTDRQSCFEKQAESSLAPALGPFQPMVPWPHTVSSKVARGSLCVSKEHDTRPAT